MPVANSSPGTLGLYINSFTKRGSSTNPYKQLLGADGYGNYSGGNKLTDLFNYTNQFGYNYGIFYDLGAPRPGDDTVFVSTNNAETFLPLGQDVLETVFPLAHAAGLVDRGAVLDINQHQNIAVGAFSPWCGLARLKRIINYNQSVSYDPTKIFTKIVTETEFWNFRYDLAISESSLISISNTTYLGYTTGRITNVPSGVDFLALGLGVNDFIKVNNQWRQIVSITANLIYVDRPWTVPINNVSFSHRDGSDGTADYETYLYRVGKMCQYITAYGSGEEVELYVALPSYTLKGTKPSGEPLQLSRLYDAGVSKILLTAYQKTPSFDTGYFDSPLNANYASAPSGGYKRISDDIVSAGVLRDIGAIISVESATSNNDGCVFNTNTDNNFSGYIMEGRSVLPHSTSTNFKALDAGGITSVCVCCPSGLSYTKPDVTFNPLSMDEIWRYMAATPPSGGVCPACYPPQLGNTFNQLITAGGTLGTNLDSYINFDTLIVFDQEFMRQLDITPAIAFTVSTTQTNVTCNGFGDGVAAVSAMGGVAPFTYEWQSWDGFVWTTFLGPGSPDYVVFSLTPGDYQCIVTDAAATVVTSDTITITEPSAISFTTTVVNANCAGVGGQITMVPSGGTGAYLYSCVLQGNPPVWGSNPVFTGLTTGTWTCTLADGNPIDSCITSTNVAVATGSSFTITGTQINTTCNSGFGSLDITPSTPGIYTYNLYDSTLTLIQSNTSGSFSNLLAGDYTIEATNSLGCISNTLSKTITEPTEVTASGTNTDPTCYLGTDGSITIVASGGSGVYSYFIEYPSGVTLNNGSGIFTGLGPLTYNYYVQDGLGCQSNIGSITISNPSQITPVYEVIQISEDLAIGGSITLNYISGGTNPYSYLWNTGETTESLSNLVPGTYTVTITDDNGCEVVQSFTIRVECTELSYDSYKVQIYKAQCCAGKLAKKYVKFMQQGREDLAFPIMQDITTLTLILNAIKCDDNPGDQSCFTCDEMITLLENIKNICSCDCCQDQDGDQVTVTFNPESGQLDIIE